MEHVNKMYFCSWNMFIRCTSFARGQSDVLSINYQLTSQRLILGPSARMPTVAVRSAVRLAETWDGWRWPFRWLISCQLNYSRYSMLPLCLFDSYSFVHHPCEYDRDVILQRWSNSARLTTLRNWLLLYTLLFSQISFSSFGLSRSLSIKVHSSCYISSSNHFRISSSAKEEIAHLLSVVV